MQHLKLIWAALWRAQASHLAVFVLLPATAAAARAALGVALLPFLLGGFGARSHSLAEVGHLHHPACWVALAPCPLADVALWAPPGPATPPPAAAPAAAPAEPEPFMPMPTALTVRHAWLLVWLVWFGLYLVRRERKRRRVTS